jgi:hypothetical protein
MKTAVEELFEEMNRIRLEVESGNLGALDFFNQQNEAFDKAKATERVQIIDAYWAGINGSINDYSEAVQINSEIIGIKTGKGADKYYDDTFKNLIADDREQKSDGKNI